MSFENLVRESFFPSPQTPRQVSAHAGRPTKEIAYVVEKP